MGALHDSGAAPGRALLPGREGLDCPARGPASVDAAPERYDLRARIERRQRPQVSDRLSRTIVPDPKPASRRGFPGGYGDPVPVRPSDPMSTSCSTPTTVAVTPDYQFEVSDRIHPDVNDGEHCYGLGGREEWELATSRTRSLGVAATFLIVSRGGALEEAESTPIRAALLSGTPLGHGVSRIQRLASGVPLCSGMTRRSTAAPSVRPPRSLADRSDDGGRTVLARSCGSCSGTGLVAVADPDGPP